MGLLEIPLSLSVCLWATGQTCKLPTPSECYPLSHHATQTLNSLLQPHLDLDPKCTICGLNWNTSFQSANHPKEKPWLTGLSLFPCLMRKGILNSGIMKDKMREKWQDEAQKGPFAVLRGAKWILTHSTCWAYDLWSGSSLGWRHPGPRPW